MQFIQILKNYLFSSNWGLINPSYRFSPIFYKRLPIDFLLRVFTFLPFLIFLAVMSKNGYFKEIADTMLESGQNFYGYLIVMVVYIPAFIFFVVSLIVSTIGSGLKRTVFTLEDEDNSSVLPSSYLQAFLNSWKNLWFITLETFVVIFLAKIILELYVANTFSLSVVVLVKATLITVGTSAILASIVSLPWLKSKKENIEDDNNTVVASE